MRELFEQSRGTYGCPRLHAAFWREGVRLSRKRAARLKREEGLQARQRRSYKRTMNYRHAFPVAGNVLARRFDAPAPNTAWATDITYIDTREGWLRLAASLDLHPRLVGRAMSNSMDRKLCLDPLEMALRGRKLPPGLIHHSDRGSQYASGDYRRLLDEHGIVCSMSRKGVWWDKRGRRELLGHGHRGARRQEGVLTSAAAKSALFEYIEVFYNRRGCTSTWATAAPPNSKRLTPRSPTPHKPTVHEIGLTQKGARGRRGAAVQAPRPRTLHYTCKALCKAVSRHRRQVLPIAG